MAKELDMNMIPYEEAEGVAYSKEVFASIKGKKSLGIFIRSGKVDLPEKKLRQR